MTAAKKIALGIVACGVLGSMTAAPAAADPVPLAPPTGSLSVLPPPLACLATTGSALFCIGIT